MTMKSFVCTENELASMYSIIIKVYYNYFFMKGYRQGVKVYNQLSCTPLKGTYYQKTISEGELTGCHMCRKQPQEPRTLKVPFFWTRVHQIRTLHVSGTLP